MDKSEIKDSFKDMMNQWLWGAGWGVTARGTDAECLLGVMKMSGMKW